jgi:hypothetical protein
LPRVPAKLVALQRHANPWAGWQMDVKVSEVQRLLHEIIGQYLWSEMLAAPVQAAQPGEGLQMGRDPD